jgi:hypothetical protein
MPIILATLRGRVQEDGSLKAPLGKYFGDHISKKKKKPHLKKTLVEWLKW